MMRQIPLGFLTVAACFGLMCAPWFDSCPSGSDAGAQMGIPQGAYTGNIRVAYTLTPASVGIPTTIGASPYVHQATLHFSPEGELLLDDGTPIAVGFSYYNEDTGHGATVESLFIDWGIFNISESGVLDTVLSGLGQAIQMTGTDTISLTDLGRCRVRYEYEAHYAGQAADGQSITVDMTAVGILVR